jgi:SAM-dependent MidA family methyltransferase
MISLTERVQNLIGEKGKITFAEFMDLALYAEGQGYYQKQNPFGHQGSFYTSVNASASFGRTLANAFADTCERLRLPAAFCEMGAGSGMLANDILTYLKETRPEFYSQLNYTIIEKSEYLISRQQELLKEHEGKVNWLSFQKFNDFKGVFFSNELVDAFPVHRVIRIGEELKELYVVNHENGLTFFPDELSTPRIQEYLDRINLRVTDGQIVDLNLDMIGWIKSLSSKIKKGIIYTIDYGYPAENIFASYRRDGTVTCYYKHGQNNDFFERIGEQDITAFVDFTSLQSYGKDAGLENITLSPQWLFLVQSGILDEISKAKTDLQKASIKALIMPEGGFGTNFFVLMQAKNVKVPDDFPYKKSAFETLDLMSKNEAFQQI